MWRDKMSSGRLRWSRSFPGSHLNFDLTLTNPDELDVTLMQELLKSILEQTHRGLTLSSRASDELERWFQEPRTPLKSTAIVLLSNWFTTRSGDRHSTVAGRCEILWDALFACRPTERLSLSKAGQNHIATPAAFERFWDRLRAAQDGDSLSEIQGGPSGVPPPELFDVPSGNVRATIARKS